MELITTIVKLLESVLLNTYTLDQEKDIKKYYGQYVGCKPFQEKKFEIEILDSSDSVFSPDSEYGFEKS